MSHTSRSYQFAALWTFRGKNAWDKFNVPSKQEVLKIVDYEVGKAGQNTDKLR